MKTRNSMRLNVIISFGRQTMGIALQLATIVLIARGLGAAGTGQFAIATVTSLIISKFFGFGIGPSLLFHVGRGGIPVRDAIRFILLISALSTSLGTFLGLSLLKHLAPIIFPKIEYNTILLGYYLFPLIIFNEGLSSILQGKEKLNSYNLSLIINPAAVLITISILTLVQSLSVNNSIIALYVGHSLAALFLLFSVRKEFEHENIALRSSLYSISISLFKYGLKAQAANLIAALNKRMDLVIVNYILNPMASGIYSISKQIPERLAIIPSSISTVILPRLTSLHRAPEKRQKIMETSFRICISISLAASFMLLIFGKPAISYIFGNEFTKAYGLLIAMLPAFVAQSGSTILANAIAARGHPEINTIVAIIALITTSFLCIILIPRFGAIGGGYATSTSAVVTLLILVRCTFHLEPKMLLKQLIPKLNDILPKS